MCAKSNTSSIRLYNFAVQIDISPEQEYVLTGGGLPGAYVMDQMHFHWGSEHLINGQRYFKRSIIETDKNLHLQFR